MKKILFIAYHFPPDDAVGGLRIARFAKFLPSFGWEPVVLTRDMDSTHSLDSTRLDYAEGVEVFNARELPSLRDIYLYLKRKLSKQAMDEVALASSLEHAAGGKETLIRRLKRYVVSLIVLLPDGKKNWVLPALLKAVYLIRKKDIRYIVTSGPPHSSHIIGLLAKKLTGVKWIADFRDPWVDALEFKPRQGRCALSDKADYFLEKKVIGSADMVTATADSLKGIFQERYRDHPGEKFRYIPNGIDYSKFEGLEGHEKYDRFTITYTGIFYLGRTPEPVFMAVERLIARKMVRPEDIRIKLVGHCATMDGRATAEVAESYGLGDIVEISGQVPYPEALVMMRKSHLLLLLLTPNQPFAIPAKVYDYLGSGTEILALTRDGDMSELIRTTESGRCFSPSEIEAIEEYIYESFMNRHDGSAGNKRIHRQFDAEGLAKRFSDALSSLG